MLYCVVLKGSGDGVVEAPISDADDDEEEEEDDSELESELDCDCSCRRAIEALQDEQAKSKQSEAHILQRMRVLKETQDIVMRCQEQLLDDQAALLRQLTDIHQELTKLGSSVVQLLERVQQQSRGAATAAAAVEAESETAPARAA